MEKETAPPERLPKNHSMGEDGQMEKDENYKPWMIVERRPKWKFRDNMQHSYGNQEREKKGSRFRALNNRNLNQELIDRDIADYRRNKGKESVIENQQSKESLFHYNGRLEMYSKNKGKSKVLGSKDGLVSVIKGPPNAGPSAGSSLINKNRVGSLIPTKEGPNSLGLGQGMMTQNLLASATNNTGKPAVVGGSSGQEIGDSVTVNDRPSVKLADPGSSTEGHSTDEVVVEVGSLDSDKHSAVVF
ncbi:hypothetical protein J1N35_027225 [Gossypium stocksii]|uniref:Uncharacterized protein n=1 Tax=Gossypium stocksii TaxID=47602 RepID=A0A9D3ZYX5_9ROSI|nr:hypothetical protein J1N35_027225 [Gossypium stocksii]